MEELKLTIQEAQETLLMSQSSVYAWIDKGKLQTIEGPGGKLVVISTKEAAQIREINLKSKRNKTAKQILTSSDNLQENSVINAEILGNEHAQNTPQTNDNLTIRLMEEIRKLAIEAGKFKQLEIIRNEEKEDRNFWETKYHEIHSKIIEKDLEISALKKQIEELKALQEKKKSFFSMFKSN